MDSGACGCHPSLCGLTDTRRTPGVSLIVQAVSRAASRAAWPIARGGTFAFLLFSFSFCFLFFSSAFSSFFFSSESLLLLLLLLVPFELEVPTLFFRQRSTRDLRLRSAVRLRGVVGRSSEFSLSGSSLSSFSSLFNFLSFSRSFSLMS